MRLTGRPTEARWTLAAELVRIIWHTFATVLTNTAVCDALAVGSSKTHWAAALRAALYLHALSTILTAQTGTGEDFKITTVEASETLKEQQRPLDPKIKQIMVLPYNEMTGASKTAAVSERE